MTVRLTLALCLFAVSPALAQPAPKKAPNAPTVGAENLAEFEKEIDALFVKGGLTPEQAARRAPAASPEVQRRIAELEASIAQLDAARFAQVPQIGVKGSYTRLSEIAPVDFNLGPMGSFAFTFPPNSYVVEGQIGVPISDYALRFPKLVQAARLGTQAARTQKLSSEVNVAQDARTTYFEWVRARLQVLVAERQLIQVRSSLKQVRALFDAQRFSKADLMRVESQESEAARQADQLRYLAALREEQLRLQIGAPSDEKLDIGEEAREEVAAPPPAGLDDLMKQAVARRLEFRAIDLSIQAKEKQQQSAKADGIPRLSAFAVGDYSNPNPRIFPQKAQWDFTWQAGVQLTWSLNDTLQSSANQRRLIAETNQLRADRESLLRGTRIEVLSAEQGVQTALLSLQTTKKGLEAAEESYRVRRELLNADRATAIELVDAETDLTRARIAAIDARINLRIALYALAHALGQDTPGAK